MGIRINAEEAACREGRGVRRSGGEGVKRTEAKGADLRGPHSLFLKDFGFYTE